MRISEVIAPLDFDAARLSRAKQMGFDTDHKLYHSTHYDYSQFVPSKWRGASYFSPTPHGAIKGGSSGGAEHLALSGPTTPAPQVGPHIIPVFVAGRIWGRDPIPENWLPKQITYGEYKNIMNGTNRISVPGMNAKQNADINHTRHEAAYEYYNEGVPEEEYDKYTGQFENDLPLVLKGPPVPKALGYSSIEGGKEPNAFAPSDSMSPTERRQMLLQLGYSGWIVDDEGGKSVAMADPTKIRSIFAQFDPNKAGSDNLLA